MVGVSRYYCKLNNIFNYLCHIILIFLVKRHLYIYINDIRAKSNVVIYFSILFF